jgi:putative component of toxin-antitoxin plasmid stabilization module
MQSWNAAGVGGDKRTQDQDIKAAKKLAKEFGSAA